MVLNTDSFINAFVRITSKGGGGGELRRLRQLVDDFNHDRITTENSKQRPIQWQFDPLAAPHFGGVSEAMIKSAKRALKSILENADVTDEGLLKEERAC